MQKLPNAYSELGYYIHRVATLIDKRGDELFRKQLGISLRQFLLLRLVEADSKHSPSQQAIADRLGIVKSAASRHIDIARQKGWLEVKVSRTSRRQHMLLLTVEGKHLLMRAKSLIQQSEAEGFGDLPLSDVESTLRVLESVYKKLA